MNRRQFLFGVGWTALAAALAACARALQSVGFTTSPGATTPGTPSPVASTPGPTPSTPVPDLRLQVAQMLIVGFRGLTVDDSSPIVADIRERGLGGVILFDRDLPTGSAVRNIESPEQVAALTAALQSAAMQAQGTPLLIAVDEEGGLVQRLGPSHGFPAYESAQVLGERDDPDHTRTQSAAMATVLRNAGVNLNLAPVVDVNANPDNPIIGALGRSFSADPAVVAQQAAAFVEGHRGVVVRTALKHFPGHGSSTTDSHQGFVDVTETWSEVELIPYRTLMAAGDVDAVLTAHVYNANLDPDYPATLSSATINGLLRGTLGWEGVVISDDLQMSAIRGIYGTDEALARCINAGVDILLIAQQQVWEDGVVADTIDRVVALVERGEIRRERIAEAAARVAALKGSLTRS